MYFTPRLELCVGLYRGLRLGGFGDLSCLSESSESVTVSLTNRIASFEATPLEGSSGAQTSYPVDRVLFRSPCTCDREGGKTITRNFSATVVTLQQPTSGMTAVSLKNARGSGFGPHHG